MKRQDFHFDLPAELIAKMPLPERRQSRLLSLDGNTGACQHQQFSDLPRFLQPGDCLIFNNTKVIPARVFGRKPTGGQIEILFERLLDSHHCLAHVRASKAPKAGTQIILEDDTQLTVTGRQEALFEIACRDEPIMDVLERIGHMPLPPYIDRADTDDDKDRYQTVYAKEKGAVAAPTAGLHFDDAMLETLKEKGIGIGFVTLHVGAGTFQPVRADDIRDHHMHSEWAQVSESVCDLIQKTKSQGGRVIAVGTTSVRSLESMARQGEIKPFEGDTDIFIYPGYEFQVIDAMITNFHLPESTLLMLISAFAGFGHVMSAYQCAIEERYRFFSYGDAMFITRKTQ